MNEVAFVEKSEADWRRLAFLTDRADLGPRNLSPDDLREFVALYRKVSSDLAKVRTQSTNLQLIEFLNDLVARAYMCLYRPKRGSILKAIGAAVVAYARTVRELKVFVFVSLGVFLLGSVGVYFLLKPRPDLLDQFVPVQMQGTFKEWTHGDMEARTGSESILMTSFYAGNNPFVAMYTAGKAVGSFGVLTTQLLFQNGAMLGALASETDKVGRLGYMVVHVMPHGVTEMSGLVFASAGGYAMAWALISPGRRKRGEALLAAAKSGMVVFIGGVLLMFVAAPIEGFFSFNPVVPVWAKAAFAILSLAGWIAFYVGYGREEATLAEA